MKMTLLLRVKSPRPKKRLSQRIAQNATSGCGNHRFLRAIPVTVGIRDSQWSELVEGDLKLGDELVVAKKN